MPQPDIIVPLTASNPTGPQAWVWIEAVEITRQGTTKVDGLPQLEDAWRIALPLRASLAIDNTLVLDSNGCEVMVPSPLPSTVLDVSSILHDTQVQTLIVLLRDVCLRIATGDLRPQTPQEG